VQERDQAIAQLKGTKETEQNGEEFADAKRQVAQLQQHLSDTQKQNQYFEARVAELSVQLDDASAQLQSAKLTGANAEETARLAKENGLLRNIVVRERQEEARRYQAKKLMLAELDRLKIQSDALNKQIEFLAQPVTN
jgi:chromosome segregation ATPase